MLPGSAQQCWPRLPAAVAKCTRWQEQQHGSARWCATKGTQRLHVVALCTQNWCRAQRSAAPKTTRNFAVCLPSVGHTASGTSRLGRACRGTPHDGAAGAFLPPACMQAHERTSRFSIGEPVSPRRADALGSRLRRRSHLCVRCGDPFAAADNAASMMQQLPGRWLPKKALVAADICFLPV